MIIGNTLAETPMTEFGATQFGRSNLDHQLELEKQLVFTCTLQVKTIFQQRTRRINFSAKPEDAPVQSERQTQLEERAEVSIRWRARKGQLAHCDRLGLVGARLFSLVRACVCLLVPCIASGAQTNLSCAIMTKSRAK